MGGGRAHQIYPPATVAKLQAVMNANHGPWLSGEIFRKHKQALQILLKIDGPQSKRWEDLLEDIAWDRDTSITDIKSENVLDASAFVSDDTFKNKGEYVEMRRWFSWYKRFIQSMRLQCHAWLKPLSERGWEGSS